MNVQRWRQNLSRWLSHRRRGFETRVNQAKQRFVRTFLSYDGKQLRARLAVLGIGPGDTVMVHANFKPDSGFQGAPLDLVNELVQLVGENGNLLMVSIPFRGSAYDYLSLNKPFHVKKTISMMGLVTEMFRRRDGTLRSLHPTHPVLAYGKDAAQLVAGHETCLYPCGPGSPFDKFRKLNGKILFFDVSFGAITFFHYVEDLFKDRLPFPVYDDRLFSVTTIDATGANRVVNTHTFSRTIPRRAHKLRVEMERRGQLRRGRVGNSRFLLAKAEDVVSCFEEMVEAGNYPHELAAVGSGDEPA